MGAVAVAFVHYGKGAVHTRGDAAAAAIVRIIEIGEPEQVAEFVAEGAGAPVFVGYAIAPYAPAVEDQADIVIGQVGLAGPEIVFSGAFSFAGAGDQQQHRRHFEIAFGVVLGKIHLGVSEAAGLRDEFVDECVVPGAAVGAVVGNLPGQFHHRCDVYGDAAPGGELGVEIFLGAFGVRDDIFLRACEFQVLELDRYQDRSEDSQSYEQAEIHHIIKCNA